VDAAFYNRVLTGANRRNGGLLPGKLLGRQGDPAGKKDIATVGAVNFDHPALSAFQDPRSGALGGGSITFKALWRTAVPESGSVLMKASTGTPLLVERPFGKGRVLVFTSTCDRDWTNFPIRPAFLPWAHRLVAYLAQVPLGRQAFFTTGEAVRLPLASLRGVETPLVEKPNRAVAPGSVETGEVPALVFTDTAEPGVYRLFAPEDRKKTLGLFAVNLDSDESNLAGLPEFFDGRHEGDTPRARIEKGLKELVGGEAPVRYVDLSQVSGEEERKKTTREIAEARGKSELWVWVLAVALGIALFEPWLANRISARLYAQRREKLELAGPGRAVRHETEEVRR
jgi:hypothetical protein